MITTLVTILFWTLPALPLVVGVYGWQRGWQAGYDAACADLSRSHFMENEASCD